MLARLHAKRRRKLVLSMLGSLLVLAIAAVLFACSQTPTSVPVRTFERAQRMDVVCLRVYDPPNPGEAPNLFHAREPIGRPQSECLPVPSDLDGVSFDKQLFALVTQSARGEVAVVDLSAGKLVDLSHAIPGINFLPVGALPTDVAATPDGKMVFVASAEVNKPAIYGIPTRRLLGDSRLPGEIPEDHEKDPVSLRTWPVCGLPQNPGAIMVVPRRTVAAGPDADGGSGDAGNAGDAGTSENAAQYDLVVVLPGDRQNSAKILTLDPRPFRRGGLKRLPDGTPDYAKDLSASDGEKANDPKALNAGKVLEPGSLEPCAILQVSAIELIGADAVPPSATRGAAWDDGVKYVDGGVDLTCKLPTPAAGCGLPPCCGPAPTPDAGAADGGVDAAAPPADAGACEPLGPKDAGALQLDVGPLDPPRIVSMTRDDQTLYLADEGVPLIHVIDMSTPSAPRELRPLIATSVSDPTRPVRVKDLAISPPTRDYKRFLYAVDRAEGSIMVFDVTDPASTQRTPLVRPHPELNPFQGADRIGFGSPVVAVTFARHDVPLAQIDGIRVSSAASGLLCNPNPKLDPANGGDPHTDLGFYYRANSSDPGRVIGPGRLRGIFGFATLANGQVAVIDVDDWDAPCRRPTNMSSTRTSASDLAVSEPSAGDGDKDPYHAPIAGDLTVTDEAFFPMTPPHSQRSQVLIKNDAISGNQLPRIVSTPSVQSNGVILPQIGPGSENTPLLDVRFAYDDPQAHVDQDWAFVYEAPLPGFEGLAATITTDPRTKNPRDYGSLVLAQQQARFCAKGVEDWARGIDRVKAINAALVQQRQKPLALERQVTDYVQLTENLLDRSDPYWALNQQPDDQQCWEGTLANASGPTRHDVCQGLYGDAGEQKPQRDFPILEAYDDHLVIGRFFTPKDGQREVVFTDPSNATDLKLMQCCFHHQVRFRIRTGKLWGAIGQAVGGGPGLGVFSHLTSDSAGRCVPSCDPRETLLNGRLPTLPATLTSASVDKNSALAMRNPMFSAVLSGATSGKEPIRDMYYSFSTRGQFRPLAVSIAGSSISVSPQSMRFIDSLGQIAIVDGASQGLVLIDLRTVTVARAPYF